MKANDLLGVLFLSVSVAACSQATQPAPLRVTITASDGAAGRVDTAALERITEAEIHHSSTMRPLHLTVAFNSFGFVAQPEIPNGSTHHGAPSRVSPISVSNLSATPWNDGLIVEHGERVKTQSRSNLHVRREVAVGTYTISDDKGNVLEQRPVAVGVLDPDVEMMILQLQSMHTTGHYLASRVAALSK
ncbi:MAG: hypothetical protein QOK37_1191 [Thermoanaerobaculia bacterium]|jgi:hypothetical protein|nr:hypothetical protein [Thermoanaerobaculia bacterium]